MRKLILTRRLHSDEGCFGRLKGAGISLYCAELPWRDNIRRLSCIPAGIYTCFPYSSSRFPAAFKLGDVPGRSDILIHSGNFAGNKELGFRTDSSGCILPGTGAGSLYGQQAVTGSRQAMDLLNAWAGGSRFLLEIAEDWVAPPLKPDAAGRNGGVEAFSPALHL